MKYEAWVKRFKPIPNMFDKNAGVDEFLFQPYGPEWDFVKRQDVQCVWTLIITDLTRTSVLSISEGFHIVNREGYLVTEVPAEPHQTYNIRY